MFRFAVLVTTNLRWCIRFRKMTKSVMAKKDATTEEKYQVARDIASVIKRKGRVFEEVTKECELPTGGYLMLANHEGRYDALAIINNHEKPLSILIDRKKSEAPIEKDYIDVLNCERIDKTNKRKSYQSIKNVYDRVKNGERIIVFPEGDFDKNKKNNLWEFYSGCLHFLKDSKAPIVPVCLYDTYKGLNKFGKIYVGVHYLKPIYYEEYQDLSYNEIANAVKKRIEDKLSELKRK